MPSTLMLIESYSICSARHAQLSTTEHCLHRGEAVSGTPAERPCAGAKQAVRDRAAGLAVRSLLVVADVDVLGI